MKNNINQLVRPRIFTRFPWEEIENNKVEDLRQIALDWIDENANDIVDFDDYR